MSELAIYRVGKLTLVEVSNGKEWQFKISIVKAHVGGSSGRSDWQIYPPLDACSGKEWQFKVCNVKAHMGRSTGRSTPKLSIDASHMITPNLADLPPSIKHRCLAYCYTKLGRSPPSRGI